MSGSPPTGPMSAGSPTAFFPCTVLATICSCLIFLGIPKRTSYTTSKDPSDGSSKSYMGLGYAAYASPIVGAGKSKSSSCCYYLVLLNSCLGCCCACCWYSPYSGYCGWLTRPSTIDLFYCSIHYTCLSCRSSSSFCFLKSLWIFSSLCSYRTFSISVLILLTSLYCLSLYS